jgi:four helix bundle protein
MQNFRNLIGWQKGHTLALAIHRLTQGISKRDGGGLIGQMRRAALSIPSNIAEGAGRKGDLEFAKFIQIAIGSSTELEYQLQFAAESGLIKPDEARPLIEKTVEVRRILSGLLRKLRTDQG